MNWWRVKLKLGYKNYTEYHQCMNRSHAEFFIIEKYGAALSRRGVYEDLETGTTTLFTMKFTLHDGEEHTEHIMAVEEEHARCIIYREHPKGRIKEMKVKSHGKKQLVRKRPKSKRVYSTGKQSR